MCEICGVKVHLLTFLQLHLFSSRQQTEETQRELRITSVH